MMHTLETIADHTVIPQFLGPKSKVLDLGANYGHFATAITNRFGCHCVCVEPAPTPFAAIPTTPLISKINVAASGSAGRSSFHISDYSEASSLVAKDPHYARTMEVQTKTITELMRSSGWATLDLLKLDIEGAEIDTLAQCPDEALTEIDQITVEFHHYLTTLPPILKAIERLRRLGFFTISMSSQSHRDVLFVNRHKLNISIVELNFLKLVTRNWQGGKRVAYRLFRRDAPKGQPKGQPHEFDARLDQWADTGDLLVMSGSI
jgi:FkbM family methyltransferase